MTQSDFKLIFVLLIKIDLFHSFVFEFIEIKRVGLNKKKNIFFSIKKAIIAVIIYSKKKK